MAIKKIISIGIDYPNIEYHAFSSNKSLLGADIVIFSPNLNNYDRHISRYQGKTTLSQSGGAELNKDVARWKRELTTLLEEGKTIFVILRAPIEYYSVTRDYYEKNVHQHIIGSLDSSYDFLPTSIGEIFESDGSGDEIKSCKNPIFGEFEDTFLKYFKYKAYTTSEKATPLFKTKTGGFLLGGIYNVGKGHLVTIPYFDFENKKYYKETKKGTFWNATGLALGNRLIQCLVNIDKSLRNNQTTCAPIWSKEPDYVLDNELVIKSKIEKNIQKIKTLKLKNNTLKRSLKEIRKIKGLLYETGVPLEDVVTQALKLLGYKAEGFDDGELELDQVIVDSNGNRFIGECEGKDNCAVDVDKFRQLVDELNEDWSKNNYPDRSTGILFGNPERLKKPEERTLDFTDKCKRGADREKIGLILTKDLFRVARYLSNHKNEKYAEECRKAITDNLGEIIQFPDPPEK